MNTTNLSIFRLFVVTLLLTTLSPLLLFSQAEIPITTSSKEARDLFINGRDKLENLEGAVAAEFFDKAIALDPSFAMAYLLRSQSGGGFNVARLNREKAVSLVDKASQGERHWILAAQAFAEANRTAWKEHLDQLVKLHPRDKRVHYAMGLYFYNAQHYNDAMPHFKKAIEIDKNFASVLNMQGYSNMFLGNWKEAEKAFKRQIEVLPNSPNPHDSYAEMLLRSGRYDEAIQNYQKAYDKSSAFVNAFTGMGTCYIHKGDFKKARECYQQQLDKAPNVNLKVVAFNNIVSSYLHEGRPEDALKVVDDYRSFAQKENQVTTVIGTHALAGWIHLENSNLAEAAQNFEQARILLAQADLPAGTRETNELNRMVERSNLLIHVREFEPARSLINECKRLIEKRKNPVEERNLNVTIAILEHQQGNYDRALDACAKANPDDPYAWYQMALAYEMKGDRESARKTYQKIVNWNWNSIPYSLIRARAKEKLAM
jgi:pentatricopeptide repeat protein